ncbi:CCA tRNA nucleotidyltransferase [Patescibacteria group bacterium]
MKKFNIPKEVTHVTETLEKAGFEAYLVGGCVRDLLRDKKPKDWDITTNATPEEITALFEHTFYENSFGTVGIVNDEVEDETLKTIEVTPYRLETTYSDKRHPDAVSFSQNLEDDLKRRDFTMNAIAYSVSRETLVDLYGGQKDIENKVIKTVGKPEDRFNEDALRIIRAIRFTAELGFTNNIDVENAIKNNADMLKNISQERIRDEFVKLVMSDEPKKGIETAHKLGVLKYIVPELERGIGVTQKGAHIFDVWEHNLGALEHSANKNWTLNVRLASLLHDISKPETRRFSKEKNEYTFYGHEVVGERVAKKALKRLRFPTKTIDVVSKLVRNHLFFSDIDKITMSAVRRIIKNVGKENVWDLMKVRACDRIGMGRPKENPYRLRKYKAMIEEAMKDPVSVGMLKIDGQRIMDVTRETPGPKVGFVLHALLEEVLDDPKVNNEAYLEKRAIELIKLPIEELKNLGEAGKTKKEAVEEKEIKEIRQKHWVK